MQLKGHLEVICGPMFCGKSEELARRIRRHTIANKTIITYKHSSDNRYDEKNVVSHIGTKIHAYPVNMDNITDILPLNEEIVAIDEIQFFDERILSWIEDWIDQGKIVIVAGLDQDFRGQGFGIMPELMARARYIVKLTAICQKCGEEADMTQRLLNNKPAPYSGETVIVGANEQYEARCKNCHERG